MEPETIESGGIQVLDYRPLIAQFVELAPGTIASDYALKHLSKALGEAQNEFTDAVKSETNTYGGYKYTPLIAIIGAVRPSLTKSHLTVSQFSVTDLGAKTLTLFTRLVHWDSGEWIQNALELPADLALGKDGAPKFNQQTIGGAQTYAQKYAYKAICGIPDGEEMIDSTEDKGNTGATRSAKQPPRQQQRTTPAQATAPASSEPAVQRAGFFAKAKELGWGLNDIKKLIVQSYPDAGGSTAKLTDEQLADLIKVMGEWKQPAEFFAATEKGKEE